MPRIARIVYDGYPHHIVQRGNNRQPVFFDDKDREFYLRLLKKYSKECGDKICAFCLMDNHVHLLIVPKDKFSLAKTMQKLSLTYTQYINKKYNRTGRLWECRFHSCVVDRDEYLWVACRYIENNPVRAKVTDRPDRYNWSSAKRNISFDKTFDFVEPICKDYLEQSEYKKFLQQTFSDGEIKMIRKATYSGRPIGTKNFINHLKEKLGIVFGVKGRGRPSKKK